MPIKITSNFAILDVKEGREALFDEFKDVPRVGPPTKRIPVTVTGFIIDIYSDDDGVSREFEIEVTDVSTTEPKGGPQP